MILSTPYARPVYRLRAGVTEDSYGDPVESWDTPERVRIPGASVQDVSVVEDNGVSRRINRGERTLYAPGAIDLTKDDRVEVDGEVWQVDGTPEARRGLASGTFTTARLTQISIG